jgi:outer membrane lipoprotein-sorting protein
MKKNIASKKSVVLGLCLIFLFSFQLAAQSLTLESVCKSLASHPNTTGDFTQIKTLQTNGRKLTSTGKFIFSQQGILWQTEKPFPSSLILTKDAMVQIAANGKKSVMSGKDNQIFANISETLSSVFSGNVDALKKNFECELIQEADSSWKILLTPKDSTIASVMKSMVLAGTGADLSSLEMAETSENTIRYEFKNQKYPEDLSADEKQIFVIE